MKFKQNLITEYCYIFVILGFGLSYPYKVITKNPDASLFIIFVLLSAVLALMKYITNNNITFKVRDVIVIIAVLTVILGYYVNSRYFPESNSITGNLKKFIQYVILYLLIFFISCKAKSERLKFSTIESCIVFLSFCSFTGVVLNSIFWRIPDQALLTLNDKYIVGNFLRAGAGYMDPNFLSAFLMVNIFTAFTFCKNNSKFTIAVLLFLASILLTFSRAGQMLGIILSSYVMFVRFGFNKKNIKYIVLFFCIILLVMIANHEVIFERFIGEEGHSSTENRFYQYSMFFNYVINESNFNNLFISYGGQENFFLITGAHLHNFVFSSVFEIGWFFTSVYIVFILCYFFIYCRDKISRLIFILVMAIMLVLPTTPEAIFYMFCVISMYNSINKTGTLHE